MRSSDAATLTEQDTDAPSGADARRERRARRREERLARRGAKPARVMPPRRAPLVLTLCFAIGVAVAAAVYIAALLSGAGWLAPIALTIGGASVIGPVLAAGWLAGRAVRRGFGLAGVLFAAGMVVAASAPLVEVEWAGYAGWSAMGLAVVTLFLAVKLPAWVAAAASRRRP